MKHDNTGISVIMPTYKQANFITRALASLLAQTFRDWELIIINDGSPDDTHALVQPYLADPRVRYLRNDRNEGLGHCLNQGLAAARYDLVAYLPSDDVYYRDHLQSLLDALEARPDAVLAYSGVRHHYNRLAEGIIDGYALQLVQVLHRKSAARWMEREELVTDDLGRMYWKKLEVEGAFVPTGTLTCEWVDHPHQRYKILREPIGGINPYKLHYGVNAPLRYHTTTGNFTDEVSQYRAFREKDYPAASDGKRLKIVLVGELAYNADRVLALAERGHKLYGLWMKDPYWYNTVGPVPFGHVEDIPREGWRAALEAIQPDVIYALLNWQAVPFAHEVLTHNPGIPFAWHFKEGPFICLEKGSWSELIDLHTKSDGQVYNSPEMRDWFAQFVPVRPEHTMLLDGDLPKREWLTEDRSPLLSEKDGAIHTVVPGRPIGLHPHTVVDLAAQGIHLHFYGDFTHGQWKEWIEKTHRMAPGYLHTHANVSQENWVREFSQYDAGWLHFVASRNGGELMRADWDDLNYPARIATLAAAGLPMLQRDNTGHLVATQTLVRDMNLGLFFRNMEELGSQLKDKARMDALRENVWAQRQFFTFDYHADALVAFFRQLVHRKSEAQAKVVSIAV